jgi:hypothetical protein
MRPPIPIPTPRQISALVFEACQSVVANPQPVHVPVHLERYSQPDDCHKNVAEKVRRDGGRVQCGWVIWEIPDWVIRLEFHSIWQSPRQDFVDVSPPLHEGPDVLFLPDPVRVYAGINIPTLHYPYNDSALCREYAEVSDQMNRLLLPPGMPPIRAEDVSQVQMEALRVRLRSIFAKAQMI